jgi:hypothetical protein
VETSVAMQKGYIYQTNGAWHVRYRVDGKQVSRKLADYNDQYRTKRSVRPLADEVLDPLNQGLQVNGPMTLQQYAETVGRLAGFTNRKDKHRKTDGTFPYVRLHEATGAIYSTAVTFLEEVQSLHEAEKSKRRPLASMRCPGRWNSNLKSILDFRARPIYAGDQTRVDLAYTVYALAHGIPESEARNALASRDLSHKGNSNRQQEYIDRTIKKARKRIAATGS